ncbi:hypothetical protein TBLA_0A04610 [Henningerozyma blattae CBS 6284]|uniref:Uncharacterized protein n=1 Tax=Henningerozyma blattae (strain ATCC 34711 / CBS 6284 / DSM 70876 / NBRC 10599 / NRRL Y-10934 / UCD 77-7) TaxID=1071380 RepID=I2GVV3_HENB6|nr:hypothetical protein TBLA_0A04610 [Tetrapisispora blattae CBS 6284]CCH58255.1 hypothetical protein TBLA_0A04610 [Tetrapisispora blattae CBS 6284]
MDITVNPEKRRLRRTSFHNNNPLNTSSTQPPDTNASGSITSSPPSKEELHLIRTHTFSTLPRLNLNTQLPKINSFVRNGSPEPISPEFHTFIKRQSDNNIMSNSGNVTRVSSFIRTPSDPLSPIHTTSFHKSKSFVVKSPIGSRTNSSTNLASQDSVIFNHSNSRSNLMNLFEKELHLKTLNFQKPPIRHKPQDYKSASTGTFSSMMYSSVPSSPSDNYSVIIDSTTPLHLKGNSIDITNSNIDNSIQQNCPSAIPKHLQEEICRTSSSLSGKSPPRDKYKNCSNVYKDKNQEKIKSVSNSYNKDNKRLVNQFLQSIQSKSELSISSSPTESEENTFPFMNKYYTHEYISNQSTSLSDFLYLGLGTSTKKSMKYQREVSSKKESSPPRVPLLSDMRHMRQETMNSTFSPAFTLSSSTPSSSPSSKSLSSFNSVSKKKTEPIDNNYTNILENYMNIVQGDELATSFNVNELNYLENHIHFQLSTFETLLKHNFGKLALFDEIQLQNNLKDFDMLKFDLKKVRTEIENLYDLVKNKYFTKLDEKFDESDKNSYASKIQEDMDIQVGILNALEARMSYCAEKLSQQRETMRQLDDLLQNESYVDKRHVSHMRKMIYLNKLIDIVTIFLLVYFIYCFFKHFFD